MIGEIYGARQTSCSIDMCIRESFFQIAKYFFKDSTLLHFASKNFSVMTENSSQRIRRSARWVIRFKNQIKFTSAIGLKSRALSSRSNNPSFKVLKSSKDGVYGSDEILDNI